MVELLVLVVDFGLTGASAKLTPNDVEKLMDAILIFSTIFALKNEENILRIIFSRQGYCKILENNSNVLTSSFKKMLKDALYSLQSGGDNSLALPLAKALRLVYLEREKVGCVGFPARILLIGTSFDNPSEYVPLVNLLIYASRLKIAIDAITLFGVKSEFFPTVANITNGFFYAENDIERFCNTLISNCISPPNIRSQTVLPEVASIDFSMSCFCHKKRIQTGLLCPICMSIFCSPIPECQVCKSKFEAFPAS